MKAENDPRPAEPISEYFQRTASFWQHQAMKEYEFRTEKGLRRKAFSLANERFLELEPENKRIEEQMRENEDEIVQDSFRKKEQSESRHRR